MLAALRRILSLTGRRAELFGGHARTSLGYVALLVIFGLVTLVFVLTLITVALAQQLGMLAALGIMAGVFFAGCLGVMLAMRAERRTHRRLIELQAREERRAMQTALLTAIPAMRRGGLLAAGLGVAALILTSRRGGDPGDDRG